MPNKKTGLAHLSACCFWPGRDMSKSKSTFMLMKIMSSFKQIDLNLNGLINFLICKRDRRYEYMMYLVNENALLEESFFFLVIFLHLKRDEFFFWCLKGLKPKQKRNYKTAKLWGMEIPTRSGSN